MRLSDLVRLARQNLLRNRTRSLLTLAGVAVGVAALLTLLAYGQALQQNARGELETLEMFHSLRVTSLPSPFAGMGSLEATLPAPADSARKEVPLTDSLMAVIGRTPGVLAAYPETMFPSKVEANGREVVANAEGIPPAFARFDAYVPTSGRYFNAPAEDALMLAPAMARRLGYDRPEDIVGDSVTLVTASLHLRALQIMASQMVFGQTSMPLLENRYRMAVVGLLPEEGQTVSAFARVVLPIERGTTLKKVSFFSTIDLLMRRTQVYQGYHALRVQVDKDADFRAIRAAIERHGVYASAFRDQFAQLDRLFLIVDLALAIVGLIALVVATLGIANTMTMNVLERRREIGVMKAVGGHKRDLQRLFMAESALLGLAGGLVGLLGGALLMALLQAAISGYLGRTGLPDVRAFAPSWGLAAVILALAVLVSLLAGWAPARRAACTEPVEALRTA